MRKGFTLTELIFVLVIMAILSAGTFKAIEAIYTRSAQARALTNLSLQSQIVLDQLSVLLYNRIPNSVIGYDRTDGVCEPIDSLSVARPILEWLATDDDALLQRAYDGFVDMNGSVYTSALNNKLLTPANTMTLSTNLNLIFAGAFDGGSDDISACSGAYGWHGANSELSFDFNFLADGNITLIDTVKPIFIYEKYYLAKTGYAVARGEDVDLTASCITDLNASANANTLFLFYDYYPYATPSQTFCADGGVGKATVLAQDVSAFSAEAVNDIIRLSIDMQQNIRGKTCGVHVSKQKGVF